MIPPYFQRGQSISADKLNQMIDLIRQALIQPGVGYSFERSWGGTALKIEAGGAAGGGGGTAAKLPCPFEVTDASTDAKMQVNIGWGLIWQMLPTGMFPNDEPKLIMEVTETSYVYSKIVFDTDTLLPKSVSFSIEKDIKQNTSDTQYNLIAYVKVKGEGDAKTIESIQNYCMQPFPSPCSLAPQTQ